MKTNLLLLLISYELIFKFSQEILKSIISPISVTQKNKLLLSKQSFLLSLLVNNFWNEKKNKHQHIFFSTICILYLVRYNFLFFIFQI